MQTLTPTIPAPQGAAHHWTAHMGQGMPALLSSHSYHRLPFNDQNLQARRDQAEVTHGHQPLEKDQTTFSLKKTSFIFII